MTKSERKLLNYYRRQYKLTFKNMKEIKRKIKIETDEMYKYILEDYYNQHLLYLEELKLQIESYIS